MYIRVQLHALRHTCIYIIVYALCSTKYVNIYVCKHVSVCFWFRMHTFNDSSCCTNTSISKHIHVYSRFLNWNKYPVAHLDTSSQTHLQVWIHVSLRVAPILISNTSAWEYTSTDIDEWLIIHKHIHTRIHKYTGFKRTPQLHTVHHIFRFFQQYPRISMYLWNARSYVELHMWCWMYQAHVYVNRLAVSGTHTDLWIRRCCNRLSTSS